MKQWVFLFLPFQAMLVGWVGDRKIRLVDNSRDNVGTVKGTVITVSQKGNELPLKLHYIR